MMFRKTNKPIIAIITSIFLTINLMARVQKRNFFFEPAETIWFHAYETQDLIQAQWLIHDFQKRIPNVEPFFTTTAIKSLESFLNMQNVFGSGPIKIIPQDNLEMTACFINVIHPSAIICMEHEINPSILLIAQLRKIPIYLFNGSISNQTERLISVAPFLYLPLLNSFSMVFTKKKSDIYKFQNLGIDAPLFKTLKNIGHFKIIQKRDYYLERFYSDTQKSKPDNNYKVMLVNILDDELPHICIESYLRLKKDHPNLKLLFIIKKYTKQLQSLNALLKNKDFKCYNWNLNSRLLSNPLKIEENILKLFRQHDALITPLSQQLFFLFHFSAIYIVQNNASQVTESCFMESASWKIPSIYVHNPIDNLTKNKKQDKQIYLEASTSNELCAQISELLLNKKFNNKIVEKAYSDIKIKSLETQREIEPFFQHLEKHLNSNP